MMVNTKIFALTASALLACSAVAADNQTQSDDLQVDQAQSQSCCTSLSKALPNKVSTQGQNAYTQSVQSYWSAQEEAVQPRCIVAVTSNKDVATAVKVLSAANKGRNTCKFAIRSGGHTPWIGSSNIQGGVVLDLSAVKKVTVNSDKKSVSIGPGARWGDVYSTLEAQGLSTSGGRVSSVGVGGLTTGGGISFFSERIGFVCDNVINFEIVLADGSITNANKHQNSDLWLALKGGSSNFGIVTRIDMITFEQGPIWGGMIAYNISYAEQTLDALYEFNNATGYDEYASIIQSLIYVQGYGYLANAGLEYTKPVEYPPPFDFWKGIPKFSDTQRIASLANITDEQAASAPNGKRQLFSSITFKNDREFLHQVYKLFQEYSQKLSSVPSLAWPLVFEPLPPAITGKSAALGGNSLGLDPSEGSLWIMLNTLDWTTSADDHLVQQVTHDFNKAVKSAAKQRGLFNEFIYLNYANKKQKPIQGYGQTNVHKLQAASKKYDPEGLFQTAVPGTFKVFS